MFKKNFSKILESANKKKTVYYKYYVILKASKINK